MRDETAAAALDGIDEYIDAYEAAQNLHGAAQLSRFLPAAAHPLYAAVLRELVRVDLEYSWEQGRPRALDEYRQQFPVLFQDAAGLQEITFEEYRLRRQAGQTPAPLEYQERFGVCTDLWPQASEETAPAGLLAGDGEDELAQAARAYRAFRERAARGNLKDLEDWLGAQAGSTDQVRLFCTVHRSDPATAERLAQAVIALPAAGSSFLGFRLLAELGHGAFGRVYLARQGDLADRLVAVKVSAELRAESQALAQLQHTNIVPIYSVHRSGPLQAVCMPYLGATTLADLLKDLQGRKALPETVQDLESTLITGGAGHRSVVPTDPDASGVSRPRENSAPRFASLRGLTYVEAMLWLAARLAEGLAHAHQRGIVHRDLKPANILLTDDGQPMLLDFNLAEDTKLRSAMAEVVVGGTLSYMAPEHLEAFQSGRHPTDARSDLYSLGVILFEVLTGRQPFPAPRGPAAAVVPQLLADRHRPPPALRCWNQAVSPAVEAIVRHCLEPEPGRRYQTAAELEEDLKRQLEQRPLRFAPEPSLAERARKWTRRHPRLASATSVGLMAACLVALLLAVLGWRGERLARLEAVTSLNRFEEERQTVQFQLINHRSGETLPLAEATTRCRSLLDRYQLLDNPGWRDLPAVRCLPQEDRERLDQGLGELLLLWARVTLLQGRQLTQPADREARLRFALRLNELAEACWTAASGPAALWQQRAELARLLGSEADARRFLAQAEQAPPSARNLATRAGEHMFRGRYRQAHSLLEQARRLDPQAFWTWFDLGICHDHLGQNNEAAACYSTCIALAPRFAPAYYKRGLAQLRQNNFADAVADFDDTVRLQPDLVGAFIGRALARQGLKQHSEAEKDLLQALKCGAPPTRVLFLRARLREEAGDRSGAERDRQDGLRQQPTDELGWIARGLAQLAENAPAALGDFDQALKLNPLSLPALQNTAHVLAEKLGRTEEAIKVLDRTVALYPDYAPARAGRGVLLARLGKRAEALRDAQSCLASARTPALLYQVAGIYALTSHEHEDDRRQALQLLESALRLGYGADLIARDHDFDFIRGLDEFQRLLQAVPLPSP